MMFYFLLKIPMFDLWELFELVLVTDNLHDFIPFTL